MQFGLNVEGMKNIENFPTSNAVQNNRNTNYGILKGQEADILEKTTDKDKSNNGKFDISECIKNFAKGVFSPVTSVIQHPFMTIGVVAATAVACTLVPVLTPVMGIGFGALSVFQLGKGIQSVIKNYKAGEFDKAEQSFNQVGQGTVGTVLSVLGLKQSARIAKEAKLMNELGVTSLNNAQKEAIALEIKKGSNLDALKEITSLFTTKTGLKAIGAQFRPSNIAQRAKDAVNFLFHKENTTKVKKKEMRFSETAEGKRRASLSSEEIEAEVKALYKEACDEYGIPEELRPQIKVTKGNVKQGGGYRPDLHEISINENSYREGIFDLPDVIKHESTHADQAILRQRLPMEEKEQLAKQYFLDKINKGEKENIVVKSTIAGSTTMKPPKMSSQMKSEFANLAESKLYQNKLYSDDELTAMIKPLIDANPDFVKGYENVDDAVNTLSMYAKSHNTRYNIAIKSASGFNTSKVDVSFLKDLSPAEKEAAIKSYLEGIDCLESNAAGSGGILGIGGDFNQYQFTPEEVLAQRNGNNFEISKLKEQLTQLRSQESYNAAEEARLLDQIKKAELTIEYKTKGQEMYRLYTESLNHPENKELAAQVSNMKDELTAINNQIHKIDAVVSNDILGVNVYTRTNEYIAYEAKVSPKPGATIIPPLSTTEAAEIIADNIENKQD